MDKSCYLYFYDENGEFSQILHLSTLCASLVFKRVHLCVSNSYYRFYNSHRLLPENVHLNCIPPESLRSSLLVRLQYLYEHRKLRSNCPAVELHCINRWLYLQANNFFNEQSLFSIDWDTFVFPGMSAYETYLTNIDLAATNIMTTGWLTVPTEPIWSLCPNLLFLSSTSLNYYIEYLNKFISYSELNGSIVADLFCDMQPWSSVISTSFVHRSTLKLLDFNELAKFQPLIDHNVRVTVDCGLKFKEMRYYFEQGTHTYLDTPYLAAKHIVFSDDHRPYFVLHSHPDLDYSPPLETPPLLREAAAIHFSGVEGKYLLLQTFIENILSYLNSHSMYNYTK